MTKLRNFQLIFLFNDLKFELRNEWAILEIFNFEPVGSLLPLLTVKRHIEFEKWLDFRLLK